MFSWTIRSHPSRDFSGKGTPLGTGKAFSYFWRKFSFLMEQEQDMGFPALAASLLGRLGKDQEEGGGGYVMSWVVEAGNEDEAIGRCLDLSSRS